MRIADRGIVVSTLDDLWRFANVIVDGGFAPKGMNKEAVCVAMQFAMELGLNPVTGIQNIAVINGRATIWGDLALALCENSGLMQDFDEWFEVGGKRLPGDPPRPYSEDATAVCIAQRTKRAKPGIGRFSVADAKEAKLWGKTSKEGIPSPWVTYPKRMLTMRARGFALRNAFPDVLRGLHLREEIEGMEEIVHVTPTEFPQGRHYLGNRPNGEQNPSAAAQPEAPKAEEKPPERQPGEDDEDTTAAKITKHGTLLAADKDF